MPKDADIFTQHETLNTTAFSPKRTMVAFRDGKLYVGSPKYVAHFRSQKVLPDTGTTDRNGCKGR